MATKRDKAAVVDDIARNERQKLTLLLEYRNILGGISRELIEESHNIVERTKRLIARAKTSMNKRKAA